MHIFPLSYNNKMKKVHFWANIYTVLYVKVTYDNVKKNLSGELNSMAHVSFLYE